MPHNIVPFHRQLAEYYNKTQALFSYSAKPTFTTLASSKYADFQEILATYLEDIKVQNEHAKPY